MKDFFNNTTVNTIFCIGVVSWSLIGAIALLALLIGSFSPNYSIEKTLKVITKVENEVPIEMQQHCKCKAIGESK